MQQRLKLEFRAVNAEVVKKLLYHTMTTLIRLAPGNPRTPRSNATSVTKAVSTPGIFQRRLNCAADATGPTLLLLLNLPAHLSREKSHRDVIGTQANASES